MADRKPPLTVKRSYKDGHVGIGIRLRGSGWQADSVNVDATTDLLPAAAREFAASLIAAAEAVEATAAKKAADKKRRAKWREREIAAGRMVVIGGGR